MMLNVYKSSVRSSLRLHRPFTTSLVKRNSLQQYNNEPVKLIAIPITSNKTYVHFKHSDQISNKKSKLIRWEQTVVKKCKHFWSKMEKSPKPINIKIVSLVRQYMNRIPWQEDSLLSIPGEHYIMKRIQQEASSKMEGVVKTMTAKQYMQTSPPPKLVPVSIYHPDTLSSEKLTSQLNELSRLGLKYHIKEIYKCLLILPFTLPLALVPIVPNIPGFYLSYRIYCNLKAYMGAKHLQKMLKDDMITFKQIKEYNDIISGNNQLTVQTIGEVTSLFDINEINATLKRSLLQESDQNPT